jgi:hypothetical protein
VPGGQAAPDARNRYLARFPEAKGYFAAHDFHAHVLKVERVRWFEGFGSMGWIDRAPFVRACGQRPDPLLRYAAGIIDHMNEDHADALLELVAHVHRRSAAEARMTSVDENGFDVLVKLPRARKWTSLRIPFGRPQRTPDGVRLRLIAMLAEARQAK